MRKNLNKESKRITNKIIEAQILGRIKSYKKDILIPQVIWTIEGNNGHKSQVILNCWTKKLETIK